MIVLARFIVGDRVERCGRIQPQASTPLMTLLQIGLSWLVRAISVHPLLGEFWFDSQSQVVDANILPVVVDASLIRVDVGKPIQSWTNRYRLPSDIFMSSWLLVGM